MSQIADLSQLITFSTDGRVAVSRLLSETDFSRLPPVSSGDTPL